MAYKYLGERWVTQADWDSCPHLSEESKTSLLSSIPVWQRDARSKGIPQLGAGAIFQVSESEYVVAALKGGIPSSWPKSFALDVGIRVTAAVWMARDPDSGIYYVYQEYAREDAPYSIHAAEIKAKGDWMTGACDPAANQRNQKDGDRLMENYRAAGVSLIPAENSVSAGIEAVLDALVGGQLKIVETCQKLLRQMRIYRRDDKGRVVKKDDHLCDALRYGWVSGRDIMKVRQRSVSAQPPKIPSTPRSWMA